jgi:site-specific DNA-cytosine methylase
MFLLAYPNRVGCNAGKHNGQGNGILQNRERYLEDEETDGNGQPSDASDSFAAITSNPNHAPTENEVCAGRGEFGVPFKSANTNSFRQQRNEPQEVSRFAEFSWCANIRRIEDLRNRPDIPEPLVCGGVNGVPNRMDRIKCLGNAVVPACAQIVGELILEMEK